MKPRFPVLQILTVKDPRHPVSNKHIKNMKTANVIKSPEISALLRRINNFPSSPLAVDWAEELRGHLERQQEHLASLPAYDRARHSQGTLEAFKAIEPERPQVKPPAQPPAKRLEDYLAELDARLPPPTPKDPKQRLLELIRLAGDTGATAGGLCRATRFLSVGQRNLLLADLVAEGKVLKRVTETRGRPTTVYSVS